MPLFRPVGLHELVLVWEAGMRAFPPRLPEQPIFYPVLNEGYARQIARAWNTKSEGRAGYVTRFDVDDGYVARFERRVVGGREHEELWVPADQLAEFHSHLRGRIAVVGAWFGAGHRGFVPDRSVLRGQDATAQLVTLARLADAHDLDVELTPGVETAVFVNFFFWEAGDFTAAGVGAERRDRTLAALRAAWRVQGRDVPLGVEP